MITEDELRLISRLPYEPGYVLLCDQLQAYVDDLADKMAADGLSQDDRIQRLYMWKASREILAMLKTQPEAIRKDLKEVEPRGLGMPEELRIDPLHLARVKAQFQVNED